MQSELDIIERIKAEIREDIAEGIVPGYASSFDELHEFVDANEYGGFCYDNITDDYDLIVRVHTAIGKWLSDRPWHDHLSKGN